jgi:hypothetical protein
VATRTHHRACRAGPLRRRWLRPPLKRNTRDRALERRSGPRCAKRSKPWLWVDSIQADRDLRLQDLRRQRAAGRPPVGTDR